MIYFTSDLHFCHDKDFIYRARGFESIEAHDAYIMRVWNEMITDEDTVYVLGDLVLKDIEKGVKELSQLNGKIYFLPGNHDSKERIRKYEEIGFIRIHAGDLLKYKNSTIYLSHYPTLTTNIGEEHFSEHVICLSGHTHEKRKFYFEDNPFIYNVALDAHENKPVSIEEIYRDIRNHYDAIDYEKHQVFTNRWQQ